MCGWGHSIPRRVQTKVIQWLLDGGPRVSYSDKDGCLDKQTFSKSTAGLAVKISKWKVESILTKSSKRPTCWQREGSWMVRKARLHGRPPSLPATVHTTIRIQVSRWDSPADVSPRCPGVHGGLEHLGGARVHPPPRVSPASPGKASSAGPRSRSRCAARSSLPPNLGTSYSALWFNRGMSSKL